MRVLVFCVLVNIFSGICWCDNSRKEPTVAISVLVRNKEHTLPYFLSSLHGLDYPKDRIYIWIHSDHNEDNSDKIIAKWVKKYGHEYNDVFFIRNNSMPLLHTDEMNCAHWSPTRFKHVMKLRDDAMKFARNRWADYIFMIDADVFLTNPLTLKMLVRKNLGIVAPMLLSDGMYSNFWCGMNSYYYQRTDDYLPLLNREKRGCFTVPMIHSAVLIDLKSVSSDQLTYNSSKIKDYDGPVDDIIVFAVNAKNNGIELNICNDVLYGFIPVPLEEGQELKDDYEQLLNVKLEALGKGVTLPLDQYLAEDMKFPNKQKFGCNKIYMINLERRSERRHLMLESFKELGMDVDLYNAFDGRQLDMTNLSKFSIKLMPNYEDPYHKRPMKAGEIGCFLSHYFIWEEIVKEGHKVTLVLEDDIRFVPYFRYKFLTLLNELKHLTWDLTYIGRKILDTEVEGGVTAHIVKPSYSYWTLGYLITLQGAKKLIAADPLSKMLPVDEFLPIMFDKHPNSIWSSYFPKRDMKAYSAAPLLVYPTHYTGQEGYISDTEDSNIMQNSSI